MEVCELGDTDWFDQVLVPLSFLFSVSVFKLHSTIRFHNVQRSMKIQTHSISSISIQTKLEHACIYMYIKETKN